MILMLKQVRIRGVTVQSDKLSPACWTLILLPSDGNNVKKNCCFYRLFLVSAFHQTLHIVMVMAKFERQSAELNFQ